MLLYKFIRWFFRCIFKVIFRWEIIGHENIPHKGGAIIAANHISLWDPPLIGSGIDREIHFMAKEELFRLPVFSKLIRILKAFPVKRGMADRSAIRTAITLLENGELMGLFPEGTRSKTGQLGNPEAGVAMIAVKAGVPVIPTAIIGTNHKWNFSIPQFTLIFGKPIETTKGKVDKEVLELLSKEIMINIQELLEKGKRQ